MARSAINRLGVHRERSATNIGCQCYKQGANPLEFKHFKKRMVSRGGIVISISQFLRLRYEEPLTVYFDDHAIIPLGYANCMTM
jgi:hypothetical protein